jgi:hypothetical protein
MLGGRWVVVDSGTPGGRVEEKADPGDGGCCDADDVLDLEVVLVFVEAIVLKVLGMDESGLDEAALDEVLDPVKDPPEDAPDNPLEKLEREDDELPETDTVLEMEDRIVDELDVAVELKLAVLELLIRMAVEVSERFPVWALVAAARTKGKRSFLAKSIANNILKQNFWAKKMKYTQMTGSGKFFQDAHRRERAKFNKTQLI